MALQVLLPQHEPLMRSFSSTSVCIHPAAVNLVKLCVYVRVCVFVCVRNALHRWFTEETLPDVTQNNRLPNLKNPESPLKGSICVAAQFKHRLLCGNETHTVSLMADTCWVLLQTSGSGSYFLPITDKKMLKSKMFDLYRTSMTMCTPS